VNEELISKSQDVKSEASNVNKEDINKSGIAKSDIKEMEAHHHSKVPHQSSFRALDKRKNDREK
jgi:hypothetical protein